METYIGIDFGGTKLMIGEVDKTGNVIAKKQYETGKLSQNEATEFIIKCVKDYTSHVGFLGMLRAAGVGVVGIVNNRKGIWETIDHTEFCNIQLAKEVSEVLQLKTYVDNDVKCATAAQIRFGVGQESKDFIYINVGTGLAAGIVSGGKLLRGVGNNAGEVGHMVLDINSDMPCICGRKGCAEKMVSGIGIDALARRMSENIETQLKIGKERVMAEDVFELASKGDRLCLAVTDAAALALSNFIMNLVRVTDPDTIVLGGGVVRSGYLLEKTKELLLPETMRNVSGGVALSKLDPSLTGLIGAAAIAM